MSSLRAKLLALFAVILVAVLAAVAWMVSHTTARSFEQFDRQRTAVLVEQFQREFQRRGAEVLQRVEGMAAADAAQRLAVELSRGGDTARYVHTAAELAEAHGLEVVILATGDGEIISSAHDPARFGYREPWLAEPPAAAAGAFLQELEFPRAGRQVALVGARALPAVNPTLHLVGGRRLDRDFLTSLTLPEGMRALLYNVQAAELVTAGGKQPATEKLRSLLQGAPQVDGGQAGTLVQWDDDPASAELVHTIPLRGRNRELLAVLLLSSSQRPLLEAQARTRNMVLGIAVAGFFFAAFLSNWAARRITQPLEELSVAAGEVAAGNWEARVDVARSDELGRLADAFNAMTAELASQRERLVQSERVAAWRELARRLAHELKNPLFPLQITVENMVRARQQSPGEFDEVFRESAATLAAELGNLKEIVARFSDFARMPAPQLQPVAVNELMRQAARLAQAQARSGKPVEVRSELDPDLGELQADPDLLYRAIQNLVLNALDAMPEGGTITLRTQRRDGGIALEVSDTGAGLTPEECARLFTPYYTTRRAGTGLGLAIVQSVVSDHGGRVAVESRPGHGATFRITLPVRSRAGAAGMNS